MTAKRSKEMPKNLSEIRDEKAKIYDTSGQAKYYAFGCGFNTCYESLMQNSKAVEIPKSCQNEFGGIECGYFYYDNSDCYYFCGLYGKDIITHGKTMDTRPDFCTAKRAIIILEE